MTVTEIIERLKAIPDPEKTRVVVRGYEGGANDISGPRKIVIHVDSDKGEAWVGRHGICYDGAAECLRQAADDDLAPHRHEDVIELYGDNPAERE